MLNEGLIRMNKQKDKIEFEARLKKIDIFSDTLHMIVFPRGSLRDIAKLYEIEQGKMVKISISTLND